MVIAIDVDDVLADFSGSFRKFLRLERHIRVRGRNLSVEEWWKAWGRTQEESLKNIFAFLHSPYFLSTKPTKGARAAIKKLKKDGHKLYVITGRPREVESATVKWLEKYFSHLFERVYCTDFHIVKHGQNTKGKICARIKAKVIIDDYPGYARECTANGTKVLLFSSPWYKDFKPEPGIIKVKNWTAVLDEINKIDL